MLPVTISHVADAAADVDDTDAAPLIDTLPSGGGAPPIIPCPLALGRFSQIDPGTSALVPQLSALHATLKLFKRRAGAANGDGDTAGDTSTDAEADDLLLPPGDGVRPSGKTMTGEGNVDEAPLPELPSLQALRGLRAELDTLATATAKRANMLQEELGKTDHFLRMRGIRTGSTASDGTTGSSLPSAMSANNTGQTIKLNLKKIRPVLPDDAASDKRKRSGSVDSAGGDSDTRASREIKSSFQKKKQRLLGQQQQQQRQHGLLDGLGGATTTVGGSLEPSLLLGDGASAGGTAMPKLAGEEPAKIKPANQVSINVFWNYVDGFFKNITEEDVRVLEQKEVGVARECKLYAFFKQHELTPAFLVYRSCTIYHSPTRPTLQRGMGRRGPSTQPDHRLRCAKNVQITTTTIYVILR